MAVNCIKQKLVVVHDSISENKFFYGVLKIDTMIEGARLTKEHEWIIIKEGLAVMGISDFAQRQLGDIVSIELPKVGSIFRKMQAIAIIDSVKASSDIYCALSGEVIEVNEELLEHPEWINQSPYDLGWIVKLKPSNIEEEYNTLMTNEQYNEFIGKIENKEGEGRGEDDEDERKGGRYWLFGLYTYNSIVNNELHVLSIICWPTSWNMSDQLIKHIRACKFTFIKYFVFYLYPLDW